jgi:hypothetical protein
MSCAQVLPVGFQQQHIWMPKRHIMEDTSLQVEKAAHGAVVRVIQGWWLSPPCPASGMIFKQYKGSYPLVINGSPKLPVGGPMA